MVSSSPAASRGAARLAAFRTVVTVPLLFLLLLSGLCTFTFAHLGDEVREHDTLTTDQSILASLDARTAAIPVAVANIASYPGAEVVVAGSGLVLGVLFALRRRWLDTLFIVGADGGYAVLTYGAKQVVQRERPVAFFRVPESGYGFPSGHTMGVTCLVFVLGFFLWRSSLPRRWKAAFSFPLVISVAIVACSRLILGVHYPSDIGGSLLLGSAWMSGLIAVRCGTERWVEGHAATRSHPR